MAQTYRRPLRRFLLIAALAPAIASSPARAADPMLVISGAGDGHGVGMSQWGAYGYARHGWAYRAILAHYYSSTSLGGAPAHSVVRVLLAGNRDAIGFSGAAAVGTRRLAPGLTYTARRSGNAAVTLTANGRSFTLPAPLRVAAPRGSFVTVGADRYRGALELRPGRAGGINAVDALPLEDYVAEVVPREVSSSWPAAALEAQAVAARTYALTAAIPGANGFDVYADTRSQAFGGLAAETRATTAATRATAGQVVTYHGRLAVTYFFASSGGRTEDVQNGFPGASPQPWLRSVPDPYESGTPLHTWTIRMAFSQVAQRLAGLVRGSFQGIEVLTRGRSPRILTAAIVGSGGRTTVTGSRLAALLGLYSTWASFGLQGAATPTPAPTAPTGGAGAPPS